MNFTLKVLLLSEGFHGEGQPGDGYREFEYCRGGQVILDCLFHWEQGLASRGGYSEELVSRSGSKIGQEGTLGKSHEKGTVMQNRAGAGQKCWPLGKES